jgi:nicotinamide-nucleotide amidase
MRAYILSIGSELILGQLTDTNATYLAQELAAAGIDLIHVTHVGDDQTQLANAIRHALTLADVVICTGGIGPTDDDCTREAIADVLVETPEMDEAYLVELKAFFDNRGQEMPPRNAKQAWTIPSAEILPNPVGTAPGWFVTAGEDDPRHIITMPGVPREMFRMWREQALPRLQKLAGQQVIDSTIIKTIGIGESAAEELLHDLVLAADPVVATYAKDDGVHVRVTAVGNDPAETRARRDRGAEEVRKRLAQYIWGADDDTLSSLIATNLAKSGDKLGIIEHGTGGGLTAHFAQNADASVGLALASVLPVTIGLDDADASTRSAELAAEAAKLDGATIGVALVAAVASQAQGLVQGTVLLALARPGAEPQPLPSLPVRAMLPEMQRRAGLHAVDMLRRELAD